MPAKFYTAYGKRHYPVTDLQKSIRRKKRFRLTKDERDWLGKQVELISDGSRGYVWCLGDVRGWVVLVTPERKLKHARIEDLRRIIHYPWESR